LHPAFGKAFEFLSKLTDKTEPGRYEIDGDKLYVNVMDAECHECASAKLEAHKKYIDVQFVISGNETMGWSDVKTCKSVAEPYNVSSDYTLFSDTPDTWFAVPSGVFVVFFPEDAHAPQVGEGKVKKAVVKVAIEQ
jgi:YhcH/YjgK/YiaL family protein